MRASTFAAIMFVPALVAGAQNPVQSGSTSPSPTALQQIRDVQKAMASLGTPENAQAAGFSPVFGWIPTMGTHWVNGARMLSGSAVRLDQPSQLMFSPIDGKMTLVGAAYAYFSPANDTTRPSPFADNPPWHDHPDLAPPGTDLVMLHVWFVPSPDGPFAGHNPFLPYWAMGLTPPDSQRMKDPAVSLRARKAALAIAEVADSAGVFPVVARRAAVRPVLLEQRAAARALLPRLEAARKANDQRQWDEVADSLGAHWDIMRNAYLTSVVNPVVNARMTRFIDNMLGVGHDAHHHQ